MARNKQLRRSDILPEHHVARHCNHQWLDRDPKTDVIRGVFPAAFWLKEKAGAMEIYLSMNWFEYFQTNLAGQYKGIVEALRRKRTVKPSSAVTRMNSGDVSAAGSVRGLALRIRDRSSGANPAYVGLEGMPKDNSDLEFLALLAKTCHEVRLVSDIDADRVE